MRSGQKWAWDYSSSNILSFQTTEKLTVIGQLFHVSTPGSSRGHCKVCICSSIVLSDGSMLAARISSQLATSSFSKPAKINS